MKLKKLSSAAAIIVTVCCLVGCASVKKQDNIADYRGLSQADVALYNANPANKDKIVCTMETPVGSNIPQRICRKQSQINRRAEEDRKNYEQFIQNPVLANPMRP